MKKLISLALVLVLTLTVMPFAAVAQNNTGKFLGNNVINVKNTLGIGNKNPINAKKIDDVGMSMGTEKLPELVTEGKTRDELIAEARKNLEAKDSVSFADRRADMDYTLTDTKNNTYEELLAKKAERNAQMQEKIAYGEKLHEQKMNTKATVADDVVLITNETELKGIAEQSGYYRLACDIILTQPWYPITFYGQLEGAGYSIVNVDMSVYNEYDYVGFFDLLGPDAVVQNLNIIAPQVYANGYAGAFCANNQGAISNCHVIGGMVITYLWASDEYKFWEISGSYVGGLVGVNEGIISDCSATADVDGWTNVGGLVGENDGYVFYSYATGNVAYETNIYDIDYVGAQYFADYGQEQYPTFTTYIRFTWAALILGEYGLIAYGLNGGLVGANYQYVVDSCVQGRGTGNDYSIGAVGGLTAVGGLVGGDAGYCAHCYAMDRAFPLLPDGEVLPYPWYYADAGYGIYFDWDAVYIHMGIAYNVGGNTNTESEIFYYQVSNGPACNDGAYHGKRLTATEMLSASTFSNWNKAEWNEFNIWIIEDGYVPILDACPIVPAEIVICYMVGNMGGLLDGAPVVYRCVPNDLENGAFEPTPPVATNTQPGYGIEQWQPSKPYEGKAIVTDTIYIALFGTDYLPTGDVNENGRLDTGDSTMILRYTLGTATFSFKQQKNADFNMDGMINTGDAISILRTVIGLQG